MNIIVAIKETMYRKGVAAIIEKHFSMDRIIEAKNLLCIENSIDRSKLNCVIFDFDFAEKEIVAFLKNISKSCVKAVGLYSLKEPPLCNEIYYISKMSETDVLIEFIYEQKKRYIFENRNFNEIEKSNAISDENSEQAKILCLTRREREILWYISKGSSNKEIAATLNITERTVKNHVSNIFKKLDVADRTQAAVSFIKSNENVN